MAYLQVPCAYEECPRWKEYDPRTINDADWAFRLKWCSICKDFTKLVLYCKRESDMVQV